MSENSKNEAENLFNVICDRIPHLFKYPAKHSSL